MIDDLWSLACIIAEIGEPLVEIACCSSESTAKSEVYLPTSDAQDPPAFSYDVVLSDPRQRVNQYLPPNVVVFLF
jgi:hypothetical protein